MSNKELSNKELLRSLLKQNQSLVAQNELLVQSLTTPANDPNDESIVEGPDRVDFSKKAKRRRKRDQQSNIHALFPTFSRLARKIFS